MIVSSEKERFRDTTTTTRLEFDGPLGFSIVVNELSPFIHCHNWDFWFVLSRANEVRYVRYVVANDGLVFIGILIIMKNAKTKYIFGN